MRLLLDTRRVLLVNLSKGRLGDANAALLGAMLVSALHQAALSRADAPADQRPPHHLYIDEFPLVATDAFASIFSEARKYGLSLTLAHQYLAQADPRTLDAVFGNVGTLVALRPGEEDAGRLARALGGRFAPEHLAGQDNFCAVLRLLSKGSPVGPINARLFPAVNSPTHRSGWLRVHSRRRFSTAIPVVKGHGL